MKNATPPAERLLNLVIALMNATTPMSRREIQATVAGYDRNSDPKAAERMFERDKDTLRELGVPIVTVESATSHAEETGYRIDKDQYTLGELELDPAEIGLLSLATQLWRDTALESDSQLGLTKLKSTAASTDSSVLIGFDPRVGTDSPALEPLLEAVTGRQRVQFDYRTGHTGEQTTREVEPWSVLARGSGWYVVAWDTTRQAQRTFKLNRIVGNVKRIGAPAAYDIPQDIDFSALLAATETETQTAQLALRAGRGGALRLRGRESNHIVPRGYDAITLTFHDLTELADELAGQADAVLVCAPPELRTQVIARLRAAATLNSSSGTGNPSATKEAHND
jgi:proteasome accessory factor B